VFCTRIIEPGSEGFEIGTHQKQFNKVGLAKGDLSFLAHQQREGFALAFLFLQASTS
jgi:hypothetical protein